MATHHKYSNSIARGQNFLDGLSEKLGETPSVLDFGVVANARKSSHAAISASSPALTITGGSLSSADIGKTICVDGAGAAGAPLVTTISAVSSSTSATLSAPASVSVSGANCIYGTDNAVAIRNAIAACQVAQKPLYWPGGEYLFADTIEINAGMEMIGPGGANNCGAIIYYVGTGSAWKIRNTLGTGNQVFAVNWRGLGFNGRGGASKLFEVDTLSQAYFWDLSVNADNLGFFDTIFDILGSNILTFKDIVATCANTGFKFYDVGGAYTTAHIKIIGGNLYQLRTVFKLQNNINHVMIEGIWVERFDSVFDLDNTNTAQGPGVPALFVSHIVVRGSQFLANDYVNYSASPKVIKGVGVTGKYWVVSDFYFENNRSFFITPEPEFPIDINVLNLGSTFTRGRIVVRHNLWSQVATAIVANATDAVDVEVEQNMDEFPWPPTRANDASGSGSFTTITRKGDCVGIGVNHKAPQHLLHLRETRVGKPTRICLQKAPSQPNTQPPIKVLDSSGNRLFECDSDDASNVFIGIGAGEHNAQSPTGAGRNDVFVGPYSGLENTTGQNNTALGSVALTDNTTGNRNTAIGNGAMQNADGSSDNVAVGYATLKVDTGGGHTAVGRTALYANTTGVDNTAVGLSALEGNVSGDGNVAVGRNAGVTSDPANANVSGDSNTFIGTYSGPASATQISNATAIGAGARADASNQVCLGNGSVIDVYLGGKTHLYLGATAGTGYPGYLWFKDDGKLYVYVDTLGWKPILFGGDLAITGLTIDDTTPFLQLKKSGVLKFEVDENGDITTLRKLTASSDVTLTGLSTSDSPLFVDASKKIIAKQVDLGEAAHVDGTGMVDGETMVWYGGKCQTDSAGSQCARIGAMTTGGGPGAPGSFTSSDGKTVSYDTDGRITNVV